MFKTNVGALIDPSAEAYLRPETAQGIFVNFKNVLSTARVKLPFGIAQIGKSFRNEITPRYFTYRSREFEQMEIEFFCRPEESRAWYAYWRDRRFQWYVSLGLQSEKLRLRDHGPEELSHYSCGTADIEYAFPFLEEGDFGELEGIAHRGDFDLRSHMEGKLVRDGRRVRRRARPRREAEVPREREGPRLLRRGDERAPDSARHRALCGRGPGDPRVSHRGVHRGRRPRRERGPAGARGPSTSPAPRPGQGRGLPAHQARGDARDGRGDLPRPQAPLERLLRREGLDRPPLPPPGRVGDAVLHHGRYPVARGRDRDPARPRLDEAGPRGGKGPRRRLAGAALARCSPSAACRPPCEDVARLRYEALSIPPFTLFFHPSDPLPYFNYAIPDEPVSAGLAPALRAVREAFKKRGLRGAV